MSQAGAQPQEPAVTYKQRHADFGVLHARLDRRARQNGNLNLGLFLGAFVALVVGSVRDDGMWYMVAGVLAAAFIAALLSFQNLRRKAGRAATLVAINQEGLHRLARNWEALPAPPDLGSPKSDSLSLDSPIDPATAADLDLFGVASVQHLLNTPATPVGQAAIFDWLLQAAPPGVVTTRQEAVRELAPQVDFREEVGARGREVGPAQRHYERFAAWAESDPWLIKQPLLLWMTRLLPLLNIGLGVAAWFWGQEYGTLYLALGASLAISVFLSLTAGRRAGETIGQVEAQQDVFAAYADIFDHLAAQPVAAPELRRLQAQLAFDAASAGDQEGAIPHPLRAGPQMRKLQRLMPFAGIRHWLLFFPIEVVTLWDFHLLWLLERWQVRAGKYVRGWLAALGEFEALIALATLHYDHPSWSFPTVEARQTSSAPQVEATNLAHPLLPPERAVGNDVKVGPPGSFLLITGSNMSGKSTLLRAIGVNCVLAQMGAPICGDTLRLPPLRARREDILLLLAHFLGDGPPLHPALAEALLLYRWPWNVRELAKVATELKLRGAKLPQLQLDLVADRLTTDAAEPKHGAAAEPVAQAARPATPQAKPADPVVIRRDELLAALKANGGRIAHAARQLGKSRQQIYRLLELHGLSKNDFRDDERDGNGETS